MQLPEHIMRQLIEEQYRKYFERIQLFCDIRLKYKGIYDSEQAYDLAQEVFAIALEDPDEYFSKENQVGWLYGIAKNKVREYCAEHQRWARRLQTLPPPESYSIEHAVEAKIDLEHLLPPEDAKLLRRLYLEGYTYDELCEAYHLKKSTLAMRVKRAKENFVEKYGE